MYTYRGGGEGVLDMKDLFRRRFSPPICESRRPREEIPGSQAMQPRTHVGGLPPLTQTRWNQLSPLAEWKSSLEANYRPLLGLRYGS